MTEFSELGLSPAVLKSVQRMDFKHPTPIQIKAIPLALAGHDIIGLAQTGTGKTAAFGLPLVDKMSDNRTKPAAKFVHALILAPTRELVNQIRDNLREYVKGSPLWVETVIGGASINVQMRKLGRGTDILVATPGRLLDLVERKAVDLSAVRFLVLDEADQMLDLGFIHDLRKIARHVGPNRQTLLFSATMPAQIADLAKTYLRDPVRVEVSPPGKSADKITQSIRFVEKKQKTEELKDLLIQRRDDLSLVFCRTKHGAEKLMKHLVEYGHEAASIHGNKSQGQRERAIKAFKKGDVRVLVATDVAARGIDIPDVTHVYNYDLPEVPEAYVHRIGRTARAGKGGEAISLVAADEMHMLRGIEKLMKIDIPVAAGEAPEAVKPAPRGKRDNPRRGAPKARGSAGRHTAKGSGSGAPGRGAGNRSKPRPNPAPKKSGSTSRNQRPGRK